MHSFRNSMVSSAIMIAILSGCQESDDGPTRPTVRGPSPSREVGTLSAVARAQIAAAQAGRIQRGIEDDILRLEGQIPGVGGAYVDSAGSLVVYVPATADTGIAKQIIRAAVLTTNVGPRLKARVQAAGGVRLVASRHAFSELLAWQDQLLRQLAANRVKFSIDADEAQNLVRVGVADNASRSAVLAAASQLAIPSSAVAVSIQQFIRSTKNLRERNRPTYGGYQMRNTASGRCSLGFNVTTSQSETGFLTASHCDAGTNGIGTLGNFYQNNFTANDLIGTALLNPAFNFSDPGCAGFAACTRADAQFVRYNTGVTFRKEVAYTEYTGLNNGQGSITVTGSWTNTAGVITPFVGQALDKMGRSTGWTRGTVSATCVNSPVDVGSGNEYIVLCASEFSGARTGTGDSGGSVFDPPPSGQTGSPLNPVGILFGFRGTSFDLDPDNFTFCNGGCVTAFSPWSQIEAHLSRTFYPALP